MEIVVDTNVLISALIRSAKTRELICSPKLILYAPKYILSECLSHKTEIINKSGINQYDFVDLVTILLSNIHIIDDKEFDHLMDEAEKLVKHQEDSPFMALALFKNISLWTDDKGLREQKKVKIFSTSELLKYIEEL